MAIVKVIHDGPITMYFHDDYCKDITPEEVDVILKNIARVAYHALKTKHIRELQKEETAKGR